MEMSSAPIIEGHICPNCKRVCGGIQELQQHFEQCDTAAASRVESWKKGVTGIFDKAKSRLKATAAGQVLSFEHRRTSSGASAHVDQDSSSHSSTAVTTPTNVVGWAVGGYAGSQEEGQATSLMDVFTDLRGQCIVKLHQRTCFLIRNVRKLLEAISHEKRMTSKKLKNVEASSVKWVDDKDARYCQFCCGGFGLRRRRHHCRVCGEIMCKQCSHYLAYRDAAALVKHKLGEPAPPVPQASFFSRKKSRSSKQRHLSEDEYEEEEEEKEEEDGKHGGGAFRICPDCDHLLKKQVRQAREVVQALPDVMRHYPRIQELTQEISELKPEYLRICNSLLEGETAYSLQRVQWERQRIVTACETVDTLSKRVFSLCGTKGISPREERLYRNIRQAVALFLQDKMVCLQPLPTAAELVELRQAREQEVRDREKRAEEERRKQAEAALSRQTQKTRQSGPKGISLDDGASAAMGVVREEGQQKEASWVPVARPAATEESDPFVLQYQLLVGYIEQAHRENKLDEVEALEVSLRHIERCIIEQKYNTAEGR